MSKNNPIENIIIEFKHISNDKKYFKKIIDIDLSVVIGSSEKLDLFINRVQELLIKHENFLRKHDIYDKIFKYLIDTRIYSMRMYNSPLCFKIDIDSINLNTIFAEINVSLCKEIDFFLLCSKIEADTNSTDKSKYKHLQLTLTTLNDLKNSLKLSLNKKDNTVNHLKVINDILKIKLVKFDICKYETSLINWKKMVIKIDEYI